MPTNSALDENQKAEILRRFMQGFEKYIDTPDIKSITEDVILYNSRLDSLGLKDHQVPTLVNITAMYTARILMFNVFTLLLTSVFSVPALILNFPIIAMSRIKSHQMAEEAVRSSNIKIAGKDVI
jgi:glycerol-3-phosphate O-acyltransferase/dihydroxyacetone phosphate acyltransferase